MSQDSLQESSVVREAILDAADELFEKFGYQKTTVEEIAQAAGIGKGTIYLHFRSKDDVGCAWAQRNYERVRSRLEELVASEDSSFGQVREMLIQRVLLRHEIVRRHQLSMDGSLGYLKKGLREWREMIFESESQALAALIDIGIQRGEFRAQNSIFAARNMILATNSLLPNFHEKENCMNFHNLDERVAELASFLLSAIAPVSHNL